MILVRKQNGQNATKAEQGQQRSEIRILISMHEPNIKTERVGEILS